MSITNDSILSKTLIKSTSSQKDMTSNTSPPLLKKDLNKLSKNIDIEQLKVRAKETRELIKQKKLTIEKENQL